MLDSLKKLHSSFDLNAVTQLCSQRCRGKQLLLFCLSEVAVVVSLSPLRQQHVRAVGKPAIFPINVINLRKTPRVFRSDKAGELTYVVGFPCGLAVKQAAVA
jgi:hypothetical protein